MNGKKMLPEPQSKIATRCSDLHLSKGARQGIYAFRFLFGKPIPESGQFSLTNLLFFFKNRVE